jgi:addiction module RelB/DinJ family antitoxin
MSKTSTVRALIEPKKKANVERILKRMGISHSEAINIFYSLIEEYKGFPFDLRLPEKSDDFVSTLEPAVLEHLKESVKKNRRLGELLAR